MSNLFSISPTALPYWPSEYTWFIPINPFSFSFSQWTYFPLYWSYPMAVSKPFCQTYTSLSLWCNKLRFISSSSVIQSNSSEEVEQSYLVTFKSCSFNLGATILLCLWKARDIGRHINTLQNSFYLRKSKYSAW